MGFMDSLGGMMGKMAAQAQEMQGYKSEYELMTIDELKREYRDLKNRSGSTYKLRIAAIRSVLQDRGYGQS